VTVPQPITNHRMELIPDLRSGRPATNRLGTAQPEVTKGSSDGHHFMMNSNRLPSDIFVTDLATYEINYDLGTPRGRQCSDSTPTRAAADGRTTTTTEFAPKTTCYNLILKYFAKTREGKFLSPPATQPPTNILQNIPSPPLLNPKQSPSIHKT
jgi:hypothetical protein